MERNVCFVVLSVFCTLLYITHFADSAEVTLQIHTDADGKDAWVDELRDPSYYQGGLDDEIRTSYDNYLGGQERALIQFDLSALSATFVNDATLQLYLYINTNTDGTDKTITANRITAAWVENNITWSGQPSYDNQYQSSTIVADGYVNNWISIDITDMVNFWLINPAQNYGVMLEISQGTGINEKHFASSEQPENPWQHPQLVLNASQAVPEPMSAMLLGISVIGYVVRRYAK
ncbi:MAG: DNRLRE domain-containing protein [Candidatus Auribacterota bacterium]